MRKKYFENTGHSGIYIINGKITVQLKQYGKTSKIGTYDSIEEAIKARDKEKEQYKMDYIPKERIYTSNYKYTYDDAIKMKELYDKKFSLSEIGKIYNSTPNTISKTLKRYGHDLRSKSDQNRKYTISETVFNEIDTHEKAYWLGFIAADGCVHNKSLLFTLHRKDRSVLEKFQVFMGANVPIRDHTEKNYGGIFTDFSSIAIVSENICKKLSKFGIEERKTLSLKFPDKLSKEFYSSYVLGYFDGDGSIYSYETSNKGYKMIKNQFCLLGTEQFVSRIRDIFTDELGLPLNKILQKKGANVCHIKYGAKKDLWKIINGYTKMFHMIFR
jgi:hypothetical protein